ncbi:MAG: hypothetical protein KF784_00770 [Fimbriimonadaceae bacterium]|nr:hypothetical protein [Fimbriimonadaceae bacterium]
MRIADFIAQVKEQGTLLALRCEWQKDDKFLCGYVDEIEGDDFKLRYVNFHGEPGHSGAEYDWIGFDEVDWIETDSRYLHALEKLHKTWSQFEGQKSARWKTSPASVKKALKDCHAAGAFCCVRYDDCIYYAKVEEVHQHIAKLAVFWEDYSSKGTVFIRPDQIKAIRIGGIDEAQAEFLLAKA